MKYPFQAALNLQRRFRRRPGKSVNSWIGSDFRGKSGYFRHWDLQEVPWKLSDHLYIYDTIMTRITISGGPERMEVKVVKKSKFVIPSFIVRFINIYSGIPCYSALDSHRTAHSAIRSPH